MEKSYGKAVLNLPRYPLHCYGHVTLQIYVCRNAKKSEIIRAYHKVAVKWHPDEYEAVDKKRAEQMFIDIAAAKEVLTDAGMSVNVSSSVL